MEEQIKKSEIDKAFNSTKKDINIYRFIKVMLIIMSVISFIAYFIFLANESSWKLSGEYDDRIRYGGSVVRGIFQKAKTYGINDTLKIVFLILGIYHIVLFIIMWLITRNKNNKKNQTRE